MHVWRSVLCEGVQCTTIGEPLHAAMISSGLLLLITASPQLPSHLQAGKQKKKKKKKRGDFTFMKKDITSL